MLPGKLSRDRCVCWHSSRSTVSLNCRIDIGVGEQAGADGKVAA